MDALIEREKEMPVPAHEVVFLAGIFVPECDVHVASLLLIQVEVKLLPPLRIQCFGDRLSSRRKQKTL